MNVGVGPATREDLGQVLELLEESGLPQEGLERLRETTLVAREGERVGGSAALEMYGASALLRSVAVVSACPESTRAMVTDWLDEFGGRGDEGAC